MSNVLITLAPAGRFFFGGDNTFEVVKNGKVVNSESSSYIVRSNYFPQQTTLLGMLRFLILSHSNAFDKNTQKIVNKDTARDLIGENSFSVGGKNEFKTINCIGTCFVQRKKQTNAKQQSKTNEWETLYFAPKDYDYQVDFGCASVGSFNGRTLAVPDVYTEIGENRVPYDPKKASESFFLTQGGEKVPYSDVFTEDSRIGIKKDYKGRTQDSAFYKQIAFRFSKKDMNDQYRFAFIADLNEDPKKYDGSVVLLGGDNSKFVLSTEPTIELNPKVFWKESVYYKVVLTSNSFVNELVDFDFAMAETLPFRFLKTSVETKDYNIFSQEASRSGKFELYQSGSVFYFKNKSTLDVFVKELDNHKEFVQIGYNRYQVSNN